MLDPLTGDPVYVGHAKDVGRRAADAWKHRYSRQWCRSSKFPQWLQGLLLPPDYRVLAVVSYERRYQEERSWTITMAAKYELLNISFGAAPLKRGPMSAEHRAKVSLAKRRGGPPRAVAA